MVGEFFKYAVNRAVGGAVDSAARRASWLVAAAFLLIVGSIFGLIVLFWSLDRHLTPIAAGLLISAGCIALGLLCLTMPRFLDWLETEAAPPDGDPVTETAAAVQEEMEEAVDYFGPVRVVGSALLLGVSIARTMKYAVGSREA